MSAAAGSRAYPIQSTDGRDDVRFTPGLVFDVARVIESHGYPPIASGLDLVELSQSLFRYLYKTKDAS
ncbi:hypothetical protein HUT08_17640 [Streptomyces buecherae]|uniref:Uncharacterized protein n=1 Tax=Streptomyces buecherae TaxID=2763006 RepID=A0A7H8N9B4_9ACTN|nr:hypothetical protein HUT08_17640 [Streptomyces buecherae]